MASGVNPDEFAAFKAELIVLLEANGQRIDMQNLQGLYKKHFNKDLSVKRFGMSSVKQLVALFEDVLEIVVIGPIQYLMAKPSPRPPKVQKRVIADKEIPVTRFSSTNPGRECFSDSYLSEPSSPLSPQTWAVDSAITDRDAELNNPRSVPSSGGMPLLTDLKKDLVELIQNSSEGLVGLTCLPQTYKQRYKRCLNLRKYDISSVETIPDVCSDVLEVVSHCGDLKHTYIRNKPTNTGAKQNKSLHRQKSDELLREELEVLLQNHPQGVALTALNKKYTHKHHKNIPKKKLIVERYKDDFEFFSKCSTESHQFLRLKSVPSRAGVGGEGRRAQSFIPEPAQTDNSTGLGNSMGLGLLGAAPPEFYPHQSPSYGGIAAGGSSISGSSLLGAPPTQLSTALYVGTALIEPHDRPQHLLDTEVHDVPGAQLQRQERHKQKPTQTGTLNNPTVFSETFVVGVGKSSNKESEQLPEVTYGSLSGTEMLQLLSKDRKPKQSTKQNQQQPHLQQPYMYEKEQLQGQPHRRKSSIKQQDKSESKKDGAVIRAGKVLKDQPQELPTLTKQQQQQQQQQEKQQQPQLRQPCENQQSRQLEQLRQQRQSSVMRQQDPNQMNADAVAQTIIANIAEANELVTIERVVDLLKQHFRVATLKTIGVYRQNQLSSLDQLTRLQCKVNAFIQAFVKVRAICTLHELRESLAMVDAPMGSTEKLDYASLQLGPLTKQPLVWEFFKFPPTKDDKDIPKITTSHVLDVLNKFLTEKELWRSKVKLPEFIKYVMEVYSVEGPYDLGLRINSVGLGIAAIKTAKREQKTTMDRARQVLKTSMAEEVTTTMEKIRKAVMSPADITGHQFDQLDLRRRYVSMSATEAMNRIYNNANELMDYSRYVRQFCTALRQVATDPLSRSLFQLAICMGDLSRPVDLPDGILDLEEEDEGDEDGPPEEETPVKSQPTEDQVKEELLRYLDRLQHGGLTLKDLARIETKLCQHFGFHDFTSLSRAKRTFLQFLSLDHPGVLESVGGSLMGLVSDSPSQGSIYRPSRMDLVEFIRQCDPHKVAQDAVDICLCAHYQVNSVEELGHGPVNRLSQHIMKVASRGYQQEQNPVIYETALCASNRQNEVKQKDVGLFGSRSMESALSCLAAAPLLEDLAEWSHWSMVFEPEHGNLKAFLERNPGQGLSPPTEINALEVRPGVLLRLATETSPDLFAAAAKGGDSTSTVGHLVSLVAKDGLRNVPLALLSNHMEMALNMLGVDSDEASRRHGALISFVLGCLVAMPLLIGNAVVRQVILNPLASVLGSEVKSRQLLLKTCQTTAQKTKIQSLGLLLGISQWTESFTEDRMPRNMDKEEDDFSVDDDEDVFDFDNLELAMKKAPKATEVEVELEEDNAAAEVDPVNSSITLPLQEAELEEESTKGDDSEVEDGEIVDENEWMDAQEDRSKASLEGEILTNDEGVDSEAPLLSAVPLSAPIPTEESAKTDDDVDGDELAPEPVIQLTPFQRSVLDCKAVIQSIRKEEFGVGMVLDEETQRLMDRHQERIGRSLKRLSEELYSKDTHFVLELIQNADDNEYEEGVEPSLVFVVDRSEVTVLNNECGFSESNIRALCDVGRSTKGKHKRGYIGHKGIGFKSVFRVTDKPEITSSGYHVCFDRSTDQMGYILPTWVGPEETHDIAQMEDPQKPWTTKITLPLKGDFQRTTSLVNKFEDVQPSLLLFLNRLRSIVILNKEDDTTSRMSRKDTGDNVVEIRHSKNTDSWLLITKCLDASKLQRLRIESTELGMAFPLSEGMSSEQSVFAFLPLRSYGFHFIIQGDFDIPSSREDVDADSAWNQLLLQNIAPLFIDALESFKTHYFDDPIKAVCQYLKFVPLDSQILTDFFRTVAVNIHKRLKVTTCMPVLAGGGEDEVAWKLPSETIMCPDHLVQEVVPSDALRTHVNCSYLHHRVLGSVSEVLLKSLGVKVLQSCELINIFRSVASAARQSGESLTPKSVAQWLTCIYRSREREYDISQETLDRLRTIPMIPLSSGQVATMEEGSVFFPISEEDKSDQSLGQMRSASSKPLQALEADMSTLDGRVLTSLDKVANSQIVRLLEDLGVRHISPRDVIRHHILPVIQSDQWKDKTRDVLVGYVVYIKEQLERQPDVCDLDEIADCLHVVTNHGLIKPRERPVHFTVMYGNQLDLNEELPGCDWVLLDSCYIVHDGAHKRTTNEVRQWRVFFKKLGVLNYLAVEKKVVTVKEEELDVTPWADLGKFWAKPADGVYKIHDNVCREFEELVQADLKIAIMQSQRQNLLKLLQQEWSSNYIDYIGAAVFDQSGTKLADTQSSFTIHLKTKPWLPSIENNTLGFFRSPADIFIASDTTRALLSNHVPYLNARVQGDGSGMLQFIGVKTAGVIDVKFMISMLKTWCSDEEQSQDLTVRTSFGTSLGHITRVYTYLGQNCPPQELRELFGDRRVVFVPQEARLPDIENPVQGQFVHKKLVYWRDPSYLLQKYDELLHRTQLCAFYPHMEDFFLRQINVDSMPTIKEYAQLLVHCAGDITLPDNARIKEEVLVLYRMLGAAQQKLEVEQGSTQFIRNVLEEHPVFPTLGNKWVTMKEKPLICDGLSSDLQKLFSDKKEVHLMNFGDRDRLGRVVESASGSTDKRYVDVFLEACGIEKLSDCIKEEFITQLTKPSLPLQLFLHEICPYIQHYMDPYLNTKKEFQSTYKKLTTEVNIAAKLKVMRFMVATRLEKFYRLKYDYGVFAKENVDCGLDELTHFYIASNISQNLQQNTDVRREVAKLFSCGSREVQKALFDFLGSLLLQLSFEKRSGGDKGVDEVICRALELNFPRESDDEPWEVPKPFIPEEVVVKPVKVEPAPEQKLQPVAGTRLEGDGDDIHSWPPKSGTYGPQKSTKGGQTNEDPVLKMWPPPQPPVSSQPSPFPPPSGLQQPTRRQQQPGDAEAQEGTAGTETMLRQHGSPDGISVVRTSGAVGDGGQAYHMKAIGRDASRDGIAPSHSHQPSEGGPPQLALSQQSPSAPQVMAETLEEAEEPCSSEEALNDDSSDDSGEVKDDNRDDSHGDTRSPETVNRQFHTPPQVQRSAALSYPSSGSIKKFFIPPHVDGEAIEVEFEDLAHGPALLESLTDSSLTLPFGDNMDTTDIARWGENLVYQYLMQEAASMTLQGSEVKVIWVNQQDETGEPYDIKITDGSTSTYIEVKSTVKDQKQVVEISPNEVAFAQKMQQSFHLYRVFNVGNVKGVRLCRLRDLALRMDRKEVKLFMYL